MLKQNASTHLLFAISLVLYVVIGYGVTRHETLPLFICYFTLFVLYIVVARFSAGVDGALPLAQLRYWITAAIIFRIALIFALPALSDDFYRFIWDGRLIAAGYDPFSMVPSEYLQQSPPIPGINQELFAQLNAKETYTVYPPVPQAIFWFSTMLFPNSIIGSVVVMKVVILVFEAGTLWILTRILREFKLPSDTVLWYALNPLVILELSGNVHHEGIMIFFLFCALWLLRKRKSLLSSIAYSLAVATKLIPLLFFPLFIRHLGWKKAGLYWAFTAVFTLLFFLPLITTEFVDGMSTSLRYYFQRFEFNASLYYLVREAGYLFAGFNIIAYAGPALGALVFVSIWWIALRNLPERSPGVPDRPIFHQMLWALAIYFLATTILHPWYIITLLAVSVLTHYRFPVVWTAAIFLTYAGYQPQGFRENLGVIAFEYMLVLGYLFYETTWKKGVVRY